MRVSERVDVPALAERFTTAFRKGIEAEKAALRKGAASFEVPVEGGRRFEGGYVFRVPRPSERLVVGAPCTLREPAGTEVPSVITALEEGSVTITTTLAVGLGPGDYRLIFVPWFLYDGMQAALPEVPFPAMALRSFGKLPAQKIAAPSPCFESSLNESQRRAVEFALGSDLTALWGPPGTGKTTTLAELIANLVACERRVLVTSTTHAALDQVLGRMKRGPGEVIRLGMGPSLREAVDLRLGPARRNLDRSRERLTSLVTQLEALAPVLERCQKEVSRAQQLDLFAGPGEKLSANDLLGVLSPPRATRLAARGAVEQLATLEERRRRLEGLREGYRRRARDARAQLEQGEQEAVNEARVVLSTLANLYVSPLMAGQLFDAVILEEAGMALLPAVFLAAGRARIQVVLVGDPQQLPAILTTRDPFALRSIGRSIFEVLGERPEQVMLSVQYRMHRHIGELVNELFYAGSLSHEPGDDVAFIAAGEPFPGQAVVVVDSVDGRCQVDPGDYSRYNLPTARRAVELAAAAAAQGRSVAVITPYRKQVRQVQALLDQRGLGTSVQCATVHRFQGNECDVVILDTVDGPPFEPGTLLCGRGPGSSSANLLNVSLSRARGKLILIANVDYTRRNARDSVLCRVLERARKA